MSDTTTKQETEDNQSLPKTAAQLEKLMKAILGKSFDMVIDRFQTVKDEAIIIYVDGLTNKDLIDRDILHPMKSKSFVGDVEMTLKATFTTEDTIKEVIAKILDGHVALFYDNSKVFYIIELKQWDKRSVEQPDSEAVTRGPREGFTESILTNTSLLRRKLRTSNLIFDKIVLGKQTNTVVAIVYLDDIVNRKVLKELKERLNTIDVDAILETGHIEQYIEENPLSIISCMGLTQKPDIAAARLLEGRVAILVDGTPHVLTIPELFMENVQTSDDYYNRTPFSNFLRLLRLFGILISIFLPGVAIAIITFNQEMMPFVFLISFIEATSGTPLPEAAEVFFLVLMFELLKEAGTRLPKTIGSAITIVGALIIGQAAVEAGIVGAPTVIIVALTAVSSLIVPNLNEFTTIYRFIMLFLGASFGLIGIGAGVIILLVHLISTDSFGIPILSTFSREELKDSFLRFPMRNIFLRPMSVVKNNVRRKNMTKGEENE